MCNGFALPVAQMFGAKNEQDLRRFVANGAWLCIIFSVVLTTAVSLACRFILSLMNTPDEIFQYAYIYILIIFLGIPFTFLYNILAAIIRSLGDRPFTGTFSGSCVADQYCAGYSIYPYF